MTRRIDNTLLIPGYGNPHPDRWQHHEAHLAREAGMNVVYPTGEVPGFREGDVPSIDDFRTFITDLVARQGLEPDRTAVLAHSLGGNGWLRLLQEREDLRGCVTAVIGTPLHDHVDGLDISAFLPTSEWDLTDDERNKILVVGSGNDSVIKEPPAPLGRHLRVASMEIPDA